MKTRNQRKTAKAIDLKKPTPRAALKDRMSYGPQDQVSLPGGSDGNVIKIIELINHFTNLFEMTDEMRQQIATAYYALKNAKEKYSLPRTVAESAAILKENAAQIDKLSNLIRAIQVKPGALHRLRFMNGEISGQGKSAILTLELINLLDRWHVFQEIMLSHQSVELVLAVERINNKRKELAAAQSETERNWLAAELAALKFERTIAKGTELRTELSRSLMAIQDYLDQHPTKLDDILQLMPAYQRSLRLLGYAFDENGKDGKPNLTLFTTAVAGFRTFLALAKRFHIPGYDYVSVFNIDGSIPECLKISKLTAKGPFTQKHVDKMNQTLDTFIQHLTTTNKDKFNHLNFLDDLCDSFLEENTAQISDIIPHLNKIFSVWKDFLPREGLSAKAYLPEEHQLVALRSALKDNAYTIDDVIALRDRLKYLSEQLPQVRQRGIHTILRQHKSAKSWIKLFNEIHRRFFTEYVLKGRVHELIPPDIAFNKFYLLVDESPGLRCDELAEAHPVLSLMFDRESGDFHDPIRCPSLFGLQTEFTHGYTIDNFEPPHIHNVDYDEDFGDRATTGNMHIYVTTGTGGPSFERLLEEEIPELAVTLEVVEPSPNADADLVKIGIDFKPEALEDKEEEEEEEEENAPQLLADNPLAKNPPAKEQKKYKLNTGARERLAKRRANFDIPALDTTPPTTRPQANPIPPTNPAPQVQQPAPALKPTATGTTSSVAAPQAPGGFMNRLKNLFSGWLGTTEAENAPQPQEAKRPLKSALKKPAQPSAAPQEIKRPDFDLYNHSDTIVYNPTLPAAALKETKYPEFNLDIDSSSISDAQLQELHRLLRTLRGSVGPGMEPRARQRLAPWSMNAWQKSTINTKKYTPEKQLKQRIPAKQQKQLTLPDVDGSILYIIELIFSFSHLFKISDQVRKEMMHLYHQLTTCTDKKIAAPLVDQLRVQINQNIDIDPEALQLLRFIGNETAGQGNSDIPTLELINLLDKHGVFVEILLSNHNIEFVLALVKMLNLLKELEAAPTDIEKNKIKEKIKDFKFAPTVLTSRQTKSLLGIQNYLDVYPEKTAEILKLTEAHHRALRIVSYATEVKQGRSHFTLFSSAMNGFRTLFALGNKMGLPEYHYKSLFTQAGKIPAWLFIGKDGRKDSLEVSDLDKVDERINDQIALLEKRLARLKKLLSQQQFSSAKDIAKLDGIVQEWAEFLTPPDYWHATIDLPAELPPLEAERANDFADEKAAPKPNKPAKLLASLQIKVQEKSKNYTMEQYRDITEKEFKDLNQPIKKEEIQELATRLEQVYEMILKVKHQGLHTLLRQHTTVDSWTKLATGVNQKLLVDIKAGKLHDLCPEDVAFNQFYDDDHQVTAELLENHPLLASIWDCKSANPIRFKTMFGISTAFVQGCVADADEPTNVFHLDSANTQGEARVLITTGRTSPTDKKAATPPLLLKEVKEPPQANPQEQKRAPAAPVAKPLDFAITINDPNQAAKPAAEHNKLPQVVITINDPKQTAKPAVELNNPIKKVNIKETPPEATPELKRQPQESPEDLFLNSSSISKEATFSLAIPTPQAELPAADKDNQQLTLPKCYANIIKIIELIFRFSHLFEISDDIRKKMADDYYAINKTYDKNKKALLVDQLRASIRQHIKVKPDALKSLRFIDGEVAGDGNNDILVFELMDLLDQNGVPFEILISQNGLDFLIALERILNKRKELLEAKTDENRNKLKAELDALKFESTLKKKNTPAVQSLTAMQDYLDIYPEKLDDIIRLTATYRKHLRLFSYSLEEKNGQKKFTLFTPAAVGLEAPFAMAKHFKLAGYDYATLLTPSGESPTWLHKYYDGSAIKDHHKKYRLKKSDLDKIDGEITARIKSLDFVFSETEVILRNFSSRGNTSATKKLLNAVIRNWDDFLAPSDYHLRKGELRPSNKSYTEEEHQLAYLQTKVQHAGSPLDVTLSGTTNSLVSSQPIKKEEIEALRHRLKDLPATLAKLQTNGLHVLLGKHSSPESWAELMNKVNQTFLNNYVAQNQVHTLIDPQNLEVWHNINPQTSADLPLMPLTMNRTAAFGCIRNGEILGTAIAFVGGNTGDTPNDYNIHNLQNNNNLGKDDLQQRLPGHVEVLTSFGSVAPPLTVSLNDPKIEPKKAVSASIPPAKAAVVEPPKEPSPTATTIQTDLAIANTPVTGKTPGPVEHKTNYPTEALSEETPIVPKKFPEDSRLHPSSTFKSAHMSLPLPTPQAELQQRVPVEEARQLTLGDGHGNVIKMIELIFRFSHLFEITDKVRQQMADAYYTINKTDIVQRAQLVDKLRNLIRHQIKVKPDALKLLRFIGDEVGDRGNSDIPTLELIHLLDVNGVQFEILASNHGLEFVLALERIINKRKALLEAKTDAERAQIRAELAQLKFKPTYLYVSGGLAESLCAIQDYLDVYPHKLDEIIQLASSYKKHLRLFSYSHEKLETHEKFTLFTHGVAGFRAAFAMGKRFKLDGCDYESLFTPDGRLPGWLVIGNERKWPLTLAEEKALNSAEKPKHSLEQTDLDKIDAEIKKRITALKTQLIQVKCIVENFTALGNTPNTKKQLDAIILQWQDFLAPLNYIAENKDLPDNKKYSPEENHLARLQIKIQSFSKNCTFPMAQHFKITKPIEKVEVEALQRRLNELPAQLEKIKNKGLHVLLGKYTTTSSWKALTVKLNHSFVKDYVAQGRVHELVADDKVDNYYDHDKGGLSDALREAHPFMDLILNREHANHIRDGEIFGITTAFAHGHNSSLREDNWNGATPRDKPIVYDLEAYNILNLDNRNELGASNSPHHLAGAGQVLISTGVVPPQLDIAIDDPRVLTLPAVATEAPPAEAIQPTNHPAPLKLFDQPTQAPSPRPKSPLKLFDPTVPSGPPSQPLSLSSESSYVHVAAQAHQDGAAAAVSSPVSQPSSISSCSSFVYVETEVLPGKKLGNGQ